MSILWHDILFVIIFEIQGKEESTFIDCSNIVAYIYFLKNYIII